MESELREGMRIGGGFVLVRPLGAGGAGEVWLATESALGRDVAVKFCGARDEVSAERFIAEARALASVRHSGVVPILHFGTDEATGRSFFAMPVFPSTLKDRLDAAKRLPEAEVAALGISLTDAIAALHAAGVVHRDIKPSNILLDATGAPVLADPGPIGGGTREWAAPEQLAPAKGNCEGKSPVGAVGAAADYYALGLVLYRALTGELPPPRGVLPPAIEPPAGTLPRDIRPRPSHAWEGLLVALLSPVPQNRLTDAGKIRESLIQRRRSVIVRIRLRFWLRLILIALSIFAAVIVIRYAAKHIATSGQKASPEISITISPADDKEVPSSTSQRGADDVFVRLAEEAREHEKQSLERIRRELDSKEMSPSNKAMMEAVKEKMVRAMLEPPKRMQPRTPEEIKAEAESRRREREALIEEYRRNHPEITQDPVGKTNCTSSCTNASTNMK